MLREEDDAVSDSMTQSTAVQEASGVRDHPGVVPFFLDQGNPRHLHDAAGGGGGDLETLESSGIRVAFHE